VAEVPLAGEWARDGPDLTSAEPVCHMSFGRGAGYSVATSTGSRRRTTHRRLGQQVRGQAADMGTDDHRQPPMRRHDEQGSDERGAVGRRTEVVS